MSDELQVPTGSNITDLVAWGNTGLVFLDKSSHAVVKTPHGPHNNDDGIGMERRIYHICTGFYDL